MRPRSCGCIIGRLIPAGEARALVVTLLASGRVPPLQATLFDIESATGQPVLHRF